MDKIWTILQSEFVRRVRTRMFLLTTLLAPIFLLALLLVPPVVSYLSTRAEVRHLAVVDLSGELFSRMQAQAPATLYLEAVTLPTDTLQAAVRAGRYDGYLLLPASLLEGSGSAELYAQSSLGLSFQMQLERLLNKSVEEARLAKLQVPPELVTVLRAEVPLRLYRLSSTGAEADGTAFYSIVGYIMAFLIYGATLAYGSVVLQGVIDEKASRVVELMISSVRPLHLMMGKVLGIGALGLLQFLLWGLLLLAGTAAAGPLLTHLLRTQSSQLGLTASTEEVLQTAHLSLPALDPLLIVWFILFFISGYLLYASLFAAIGSAVDQQQDAQGLMLPLTLLIVIPVLFMPYVIESPQASLSVVLSLVPFFSPILMVARLAVGGVPWWEGLLAYGLLVGAFIGAIWISARIYRIGILMYGQKPSFREILRWLRMA